MRFFDSGLELSTCHGAHVHHVGLRYSAQEVSFVMMANLLMMLTAEVDEERKVEWRKHGHCQMSIISLMAHAA